jgi:hypothetical protein
MKVTVPAEIVVAVGPIFFSLESTPQYSENPSECASPSLRRFRIAAQKAQKSKGHGTIMHRAERADGHERFKELCALAQANSLGVEDQLELKEHLKICDSCRKIYDQYAAIVSEGLPFLSGSCAVSEEAERWDNRDARRKLHTSIQGKKAHIVRA